MRNIVLSKDQVSDGLQKAFDALDAHPNKTTCDCPDCTKTHRAGVSARVSAPGRSVDLIFCSPEHRREAFEKWGLRDVLERALNG